MNKDNYKIVYYWYDHLVLRDNGDAEKVQKAIKEHDFDTFMKFYDKYPPFYTHDVEFGRCEIPYFPKTATIFLKKTGEIIGEIYITIREGFELIDESEYECG